MVRIQVLLSPEDKEAFRRLAHEEGLSLSAWLRRAGVERVEAATARRRIRTVEDLRKLFAACDREQEGREPDWEEQLEVIRGSRCSGDSDT